jgi:formylglycine-generating enzyme required for sulfatase activity
MWFTLEEEGPMKKLTVCFYLIAVVLLAACAPPATPTPQIVVVTVTTAPTDTPTPAAPVAPDIPTATATLAVINLLPPMQVGSTFAYVDGSILVAVPAGPFTRGRKGGTDNPEQVVTLSDFWIYRTKVTNQQYKLCVAAGKCNSADLRDNQGYNDFQRLNDPVIGVTWDQADAYCKWMNGHLPTEAQWEKTARSDDLRSYPWGSGAPSCDLLNFSNCIGSTTSVVKYPQGKSPYGALDMAGNAFEWVNDYYDAQYYRTGPNQDPPGPENGQRKSVRSTSYRSNTDQVPVAVRFFDLPSNHRPDLGFRCVVDDPTYFAPMCQLTGYFGPSIGGGSNAGNVCHTHVSANAVPQCKCGCSSTFLTLKSNSPDTTNISVPGGCSLISGSPGSYPQVYDCGSTAAGQTATIDATCDVSGFGEAKCPDHYTFDSGSGNCVWDGSGTASTACPDGYSYDPTLNCCTATPGAALKSFPLCEAGSSPVPIGGGKYACVFAPPAPPHDEATIAMPPDCGGKPGEPGPCPTGQTWYCPPVGGACYCR